MGSLRTDLRYLEKLSPNLGGQAVNKADSPDGAQA
jgi:hypothetical protein